MDVLKLSDVPALVEIIGKLFLQVRRKGKNDEYSEEICEDTVYHCHLGNGEHILHTVKAEAAGIYIIQQVESKNGVGSCCFSAYKADLQARSAETLFASTPIKDCPEVAATFAVSKIVHDLKCCGNLEREIYSPLFAGRLGVRK